MDYDTVSAAFAVARRWPVTIRELRNMMEHWRF